MAEGKTREIKISIPEELFALALPEKTIDHFSKARKEILLAFRSIIDARIEALEKREKKKGPKKKKIKIE
ncbi:MAG: hypothetical protein GTN73_10510 [Candidatus Aminicenantes bacterium]|nr:hypothetical protein [Candidatus Aminicenantes bacterium]